MVSAQHYRDDVEEEIRPDRRPQKFGVRGGVALSNLRSPEIMNRRPNFGLQGSFYYRASVARKLQLQTELGASFRGANFKNGINGYSKMSLFYTDFPVYFLIGLDSKNDHNIVVGAQASYLVRSSLFVGNELLPSFSNLPVKSMDFYALAGYHFNTQYVGLQITFRMGLSNVADNFAGFNPKSDSNSQSFRDLQPPLSHVMKLYNTSLELSLLF